MTHQPRPWEVDPQTIHFLVEKFGKTEADIKDLIHEMKPTAAQRGPLMTKYTPKSEWELLDSRLVTAVKDYIRGFSADSPKALMLVGPYGCGKSSLVKALARSEGLYLVQNSPKDPRNSQFLHKIIYEATQSRSVNSVWKPSLVLLDDIDIAFECDRGFLKAVGELISRSKQPIVLTSREVKEELVESSLVTTVWLDPLTAYEVTVKLLIINSAERLALPRELLPVVYRYSACNMTKTLNSLEFPSTSHIFGLQRPIDTARLTSDSQNPDKLELVVKTNGANWISDSNDHENWLDFVSRNIDCIRISSFDGFSALEDMLSLLDVNFTRKDTESEYRLQELVAGLDEFLMERLDIDQELRLRVRPAVSTPSYTPRKKAKTK